MQYNYVITGTVNYGPVDIVYYDHIWLFVGRCCGDTSSGIVPNFVHVVSYSVRDNESSVRKRNVTFFAVKTNEEIFLFPGEQV